MPWKISDVDKFKKGLTDKQKEKWLAIANAALKECTDKDSGQVIECEASAIRIANSRVGSKKSKLAETRYIEGSVVNNEGLEIETRLLLALGEPADPDADDFQMIVPVGVFYSDWYGEIIITNSYNDAMVDNWKTKVLGNREPFIDTLHDQGAANGWIEDLESRDDGLYAKINWTQQGRDYVEGELFKYFSAAIGRVTKVDDGTPAYPVLIAASLCNTPVMNTMPKAHLSDGEWSIPTVSTVIENGLTPADLSITPDHIDNTGGKTVETFAEVLTSLLALSDDEKGKATDAEKAQIAQFLGLNLADPVAGDKLRLVLDENKVLAGKLAKIEGDNLTTRIDTEIKAALAEGKILPANEQKWRDLMAKDPEGVAAILAEKGPEIDLAEHGHGDGGPENVEMSVNEKHVHDAMGHSEEDIAKYGG
tara:strand:- start:25245 stop:26510 length:1266 start_codon:yes stop_codon:yes gene_type:complete